MASSRRKTIHGVLVQVFGVGVLLLGDAGTGKTTCAMRLMARGHKLVADDAVELTVTDGKLFGSPPERFRRHANIRGVGLIDLATRFRDESFVDTSEVDLVIQLIEGGDNKERRNGETLLDVLIPALDICIDDIEKLPEFVEANAKARALARAIPSS